MLNFLLLLPAGDVEWMHSITARRVWYMEIFRFQLPQGNRREEQMEGREENGKTSAEGRKREDGIVAIERRRKIEGKKKEKRE
jgi:hypothetical protein